jgi:hypothetical protein
MSVGFANVGALDVRMLILVGVLTLPAFYLVHRTLEYCYLLRARRFCRKNGLKVVRWRCGPAFDRSGVKTEFSIVEMDCLDAQKERKLIRLLIWIFGIRKALIDDYPESATENWPSLQD